MNINMICPICGEKIDIECNEIIFDPDEEENILLDVNFECPNCYKIYHIGG